MSKIIFFIAICAVLSSAYKYEYAKSEINQPRTNLTQSGWKLGVQAYTFRNFTFVEAVNKIKKLGLHYVEAYPGQEIGGGISGKMGYDLDKKSQDKILNYLKKNDVKLKAFGVVTPETPAQWDSLFAFADRMRISTITSEPPQSEMSYISKLCDKYNIAIHNHPAPSRYWNPDTLLSAIKGQSSHIGSCADLGHWVRSGLDPVESLKKLKGHIKELHIKDVDSKKKNAEDTIWGTGVIDLKNVVKELERQDFNGMLSIEYEIDPEDNMSQIEKSINYFHNVAIGSKDSENMK